MNEIINEENRNVLKECIKSKNYSKIDSLLKDIKINSDYEKGYYECIRGLVEYVTRKNYEERLKEFNIYNLIFNNKEAVFQIIKEEWDDSLWERGFKQALKDILESI